MEKKINLPPTNRNPPKSKTNPTRNSIGVFVPPNVGLWPIIFLETFWISCGELVEQVRTLKIGIGAIWKFDKFSTGPPSCRAGGDGGGSECSGCDRCDKTPPKPWEGDFLFSPSSLDNCTYKGTRCLEHHSHQCSGVIPLGGAACRQLQCKREQLCQWEAMGL